MDVSRQLAPQASVIMFSSLLVHASPPNISPLPTKLSSTFHYAGRITILHNTRGQNGLHRNFDPIDALDDQCLEELADNSPSVAAGMIFPLPNFLIFSIVNYVQIILKT